MKPSTTHLRPYLGLSIGILAVSTSALFINYALAEGAGALVIAAYRLTIASLILLPIVLWRHRAEIAGLSKRDLGLALVSGLFLGLHFATWISSLALTSVASSVVLVDTSPLFVALIAGFTLKEKTSRIVLGGMLMAVAGAMVVAFNDACLAGPCVSLAGAFRGQALWGDLLAVAGAGAVSVYIVIGRKLRPTLSLTSYVFLTYGTAAVALCLVVVGAHLPIVGFRPAAYGWFLLLALVPQLIGHTTYNWALKYLSATLVSVSVLAEPIGSTVLAYLFLRQTPSFVKIAGGVLILLGILFASRRSQSESGLAT